MPNFMVSNFNKILHLNLDQYIKFNDFTSIYEVQGKKCETTLRYVLMYIFS